MAPPATPGLKRATTSTLAEGLHVYPPFYACYMLRSFKVQNGKGNRRTYIGSTPDPPRRWRQHNGEISGGAWKTKMWRPWEMEAICYNFPSKLVALQFEWAWNTPFASRHLRSPDSEQIFSKSIGTGPEARIRVLQTMLTAKPWARFPLKVMLFSQDARNIWDRSLKGEVYNKNSRKWRAADATTTVVDLDHVDVTDRFIGIDGGRLARQEAVATITKDPLPTADSDAVIEQYEKAESLREGNPTPACGICSEPVDLDDSLSYTLCTSTPTCHYVAHLRCLSSHFLSHDADPSQILPDQGACPGCGARTRWGDLVKGAFHRQPADAKLRARRALEQSEAAAERALAEVGSDVGDDVDGSVVAVSPVKRRKASSVKAPARPVARKAKAKVIRPKTTAKKQKRAAAGAVSLARDEDSESSADFGAAMDEIVSSDAAEDARPATPPARPSARRRPAVSPSTRLAAAAGRLALTTPPRTIPHVELSD